MATCVGASRHDTYTYDLAGRIQNWTRTGAQAASIGYTFDSMANLTRKSGSSATDYTYNAANQLVSAATGSSSTTYAYDELGRQTSATTGPATTTYEWDALGKLTHIGSAETSVTYAYALDGTRSLKTVTTASGTKTTKQLWSGVKLLAELDSDGTRYDYLYRPDGAPLELRVKSGVKTDTDAYGYQVDAGGSVIGITDSSGTEVARYAYDPYGNPLAVEGTGTLKDRNPLRYRGYCLDAESGYYHMPARYYDPASARFVSVDPAAPSAGDPVSLNGYSYCFGDPVGLVDPDGRDVLYGEYYSDEQDPTGELDANLPDHDGAGAGKPPSKKGAWASVGDNLSRDAVREVGNFLSPVLRTGDALDNLGLFLSDLGRGNVDGQLTYIFVPTNIPGYGVGWTWGVIYVTQPGGPAKRLQYAGVAAGEKGVSGSVTAGSSWVWPEERYMEASWFWKGVGKTVGFRSSPRPGDDPWGFNDSYNQTGVGKSSRAPSASWFYVWE